MWNLVNSSSTPMSDNLSEIAPFNALTTPITHNLHVSRNPSTPKSNNLLIVNIFSDIGVLFRSETADYSPLMCFSR